MSIERTLLDVPTEIVDEIIGDFESEGCQVVKTKQPDGKFTLVATCPDE
jgi:hypothetical protein